ncbi:uncharacterized protein NMK_0033 [Novimethylophilus kurashikiensis]|uniref:Uncharacterized protein n=1 Tax=Novimethylophilus kurashikiensis TaxID=1825523 RepID=A0A2R5F180_9PROT|nr:hypothetical protein [Novimethylophilus kurashikiensis]GBG12502.1 uncharacterized protein NMK_0033 [Novimethylophilus kurashikiensis]
MHRIGDEEALLKYVELIAISFPNIALKLNQLKDQGDEIIPYIESLLQDTYKRGNQSLSLEVVEALMNIRAIYEANAPTPEVVVSQPTVADDQLAFDLHDSPYFIKLIQRFPHIGQKVEESWGTQALRTYIWDLFQDSRGGTRQGFPPEYASALFRLLDAHDQQYPELVDTTSDIWTVNKFGLI